MKTDVINMINDADMVLVGIGEELSFEKCEINKLMGFYNALSTAVKDKNYFVISVNPDAAIFDSTIDNGRITAPFSDSEEITESGEDKQWDLYMKWLSGTLNKKLLVIEFGVLLNRPNVIRWPFERVVMINTNAKLVRINKSIPQLPSELRERGISIGDNPLYFFDSIC